MLEKLDFAGKYKAVTWGYYGFASDYNKL